MAEETPRLRDFGEDNFLFSFFRAITKRKRAGEALRELEEKRRLLAENIPDVILTAGKDGRIQFLNHTVAGFTPEHAIGTTIYEYVPPDQHHIMRKSIERVFQTGRIDRYEIDGVGEHGTNTKWETRVVPIMRDGQVVAVNLISTDITKRKRAEEALKAEKERAEEYLNVAGVMMAMVNADENITLINKKGCEILGYKEGELIGKNWFDTLVPRRIRGEVREVFHKLVAEDIEPVEYYENPLLTKDGKERLILFHNTVVRDPKGRIVGALTSGEDITERKKAEEALRESEERYKALFQGAAEGIIVADVETKDFKYANPAICKMLGYTEEELERLGVRDIHPKEDLQHVISEFEAQTRGEKTLSSSIPCLQKDGTIMYADINTAMVLIDGRQCNVGFFTDVTERKKTEEALRESESKYRTLVENLPQKIFLKDKNSVYVSCNDNLARDLKIKVEEIAGKTDYDLIPKELAEKYRADDKRIIETGQTEDIEESYIQDGREVIIHTVKTPVKDEQGNVIGVLGIFRDITERKKAKAKLEQYKEKVLKAQRHAYVSSIGTMVAHQINQPLTKINILLDRAIEQIEEASCCPVVLKNVKEGFAEAKKAASIIQKFRQYSKNSALESVGKVNVSAVADKIVSVLSERATRANMRIAIKGLGDLSEVEANETALEQVFFIIIQNAIEAADGRKRHKLDITGKFTDSNIELQFADDCCGIAPENLDRIFDPFFSTKTEDKGLGLGLDIVQQILISFGSQIRVESQLGKGTTFYVTLPISNTLGRPKVQ